METSLKPGFAQIFSCCPKNLSCPKFGGAAAPLAPPARTPMAEKCHDFHHRYRWLHHHYSRGCHVRIYLMKQSLTRLDSRSVISYCFLRKQRLIKALITKLKRSSNIQVTIIIVKCHSA